MDDRQFTYMTADWLLGHERFIEKFLQTAEIRFLKKGDILYHQGEAVELLYLVLKGTVESYFENDSGRQKITSISQRGVLVGLTGLNDYAGHHTLRCRTSVIVAVAPKETVYQWDSEMLTALIQMQTRKIKTAFAQMIHQSTQTIESRILRLLLEAGHEEETTEYEIPVNIVFSRQEIASIVGSTRERVGQVMNELQNQKLLERDGRDIYFYPSALKKRLEQIKAV